MGPQPQASPVPVQVSHPGARVSVHHSARQWPFHRGKRRGFSAGGEPVRGRGKARASAPAWLEAGQGSVLWDSAGRLPLGNSCVTVGPVPSLCPAQTTACSFSGQAPRVALSLPSRSPSHPGVDCHPALMDSSIVLANAAPWSVPPSLPSTSCPAPASLTSHAPQPL